MLSKFKKIQFFLLLILSHFCVTAQQITSPPMANEGFMRSEGKIYVAMTVAITILAGLIGYVWRLDRKITRLEKHR